MIISDNKILFHHRPNSLGERTVIVHLDLPLYKDKLPELVKMAMAEMKPGNVMETKYGILRFHESGEYATFNNFVDGREVTEHIEADRAKELPRALLKKYVKDLLSAYISEEGIDLGTLHIK